MVGLHIALITFTSRIKSADFILIEARSGDGFRDTVKLRNLSPKIKISQKIIEHGTFHGVTG